MKFKFEIFFSSNSKFIYYIKKDKFDVNLKYINEHTYKYSIFINIYIF